MNRIIVFPVLFLLLFISGCKKEKPLEITESVVQLDISTTLRDICFVNDDIVFVCGGLPGEYGYIWQSNDGGNSFHRVLDVPGRCLYDLDYFDINNLVAGGDGVMLLRTSDGGKTWKDEFETHDFSEWAEFVTPIRSLRFMNAQTIVAVGGDTYYKGIVVSTWNWGQNWDFRNLDNQLNDLEMPVAGRAWVCGYGRMFSSSDSCRKLTDLNISGDHYTAIDFADDVHGLACGYNGGIYQTKDGGQSWKTVYSGNGVAGQRKHLNDITFTEDGNAFAAGNHGLILYSSNGGDSWAEIKHEHEDDLFCLYALGTTEVLCGGTNGRIHHIILSK